MITFYDLWKIKTRITASRNVAVNKRNLILIKYKNLPIDKIIEKFTFKVMGEENKDFCALLAHNKACHEMDTEDLNCYSCMCPNYKLEIGFDKEQNFYKIGFCSANSRFSFYKLTHTKEEDPKNYLILNCINCNMPHNKVFIKRQLEKDIKKFL